MGTLQCYDCYFSILGDGSSRSRHGTCQNLQWRLGKGASSLLFMVLGLGREAMLGRRAHTCLLSHCDLEVGHAFYAAAAGEPQVRAPVDCFCGRPIDWKILMNL
jgi:hypothetical protein